MLILPGHHRLQSFQILPVSRQQAFVHRKVYKGAKVLPVFNGDLIDPGLNGHVLIRFCPRIDHISPVGNDPDMVFQCVSPQPGRKT